MTEHILISTPDIRNYLFGCTKSSTFTLVSKKTGSRFTFRLRRDPSKHKFFFVDGLAGEDNVSDYCFLGSVRERVYRDNKRSRDFNWSVKSPIASDAPLVIAIDFFIARIKYKRDLNPAKIEFWYSGHCSQCGRLLTVPQSLARGMGPKCYVRAQELLR